MHINTLYYEDKSNFRTTVVTEVEIPSTTMSKTKATEFVNVNGRSKLTNETRRRKPEEPTKCNEERLSPEKLTKIVDIALEDTTIVSSDTSKVRCVRYHTF